MKVILTLILIVLAMASVIFYSCQKEYSCEGCNSGNNPPVANAGKDTSITLPNNSLFLNGSASTDPDNNIISYKWTKVSGPTSFIIANDTAVQTRVSGLIKGMYQFELIVTDAGGLSDKDTVIINVNDITHHNTPPIADAGSDQTIILPSNSADLDGSASSDMDNNIVSYLWTKISGPESAIIINDAAEKTTASNLTAGNYFFELKVTDAEGLFDKDTVMVIVEDDNCHNSNRPVVNAQLVPVGTLSSARYIIAAASAGNKIFFAGGTLENGHSYSAVVDIFDISANTWSTARLSAAREGIMAITAGNKVFFAGGGYLYGDYYYDNVDIYNTSDNSWAISSLNEPQTELGGGAIGNKVMFAGGFIMKDYEMDITKTVEVYDLSTNSWSLNSLSEPRGFISGVTVEQKIFFAGGLQGARKSGKIDIYDNSTNTWSTALLSFVNGPLTGVTDGQKIYWASSGCNVEIFDPVSGTSTLSFLHKKGVYHSVVKDHKIIFFGGDPYLFDIYDPATDQWSVGVLPSPIPYASGIICVNNTIYVAGGAIGCLPTDNGNCNSQVTNQVYRLEF